MNDLSFAIRQFLKSPGFTTVAVLTLALGIGANSVAFSLFKGILLRPLGFEEERRLVWIQAVNRATGIGQQRLSRTDYADLLAETRSFESIAAFNAGSPIWDQGDRADRLAGISVTPNLAETLRIRPVLGRSFTEANVPPHGERVVMISYELWQGRFGRSPDVLGQTMRLREHLYTIIGVLPPGLGFPLGRAPAEGNGSTVKTGVQDVWMPLSMDPGTNRARGERMFPVLARLREGVSVKGARAELAALAKRWQADYPDTNAELDFAPLELRQQVFGQMLQGLQVMSVAVAAVLLICCANLANLLLARGINREREIAVRLALGARRTRVVRGLMIESVVLAIAGGSLGLAFAVGTVQMIRVFSPADVPFVREVNVDAPVAAFSIGLSLLTAVLFGFFPAWRQSAADAANALRSGTRSSMGRGLVVWQKSLLAGQIALVLVLLTSAGLLLESFRRMMNLDLGYKAESVITVHLNAWNLPTNEDNARLYQQMHREIAALPGVRAAGVISSLPLTGKWTFQEKAEPVGRALTEAEKPALSGTFVAFDYFQAMDIPLIAGRHFRDDELFSNTPHIIINEAAAASLFPGMAPANVIGQRFSVGSKNRPLEIIGIVKDTRDVHLEQRPQPRMYWLWPSGGAEFVVRVDRPSAAMIPLLRDVVKSFGSKVMLHDIRPMSDIVSGTVAERRFLMMALAAYAAIALGIAIAGISGVVAYQVAQRTKEFGVRLALGSTRSAVLGLVLKQAGAVVISGLLIGLAISLVTNRLLASQLFQLSPHDPFLLTITSALLLVVALIASLLPARRAANVNPIEALRYE